MNSTFCKKGFRFWCVQLGKIRRVRVFSHWGLETSLRFKFEISQKFVIGLSSPLGEAGCADDQMI